MAAASTAVEVRKPREARRKEGADDVCVASAVMRVSVRLEQVLTSGPHTRLSPEEHRSHFNLAIVTELFRICSD
jgi:hypothetical protein